jgi:hypothetical protein
MISGFVKQVWGENIFIVFGGRVIEKWRGEG